MKNQVAAVGIILLGMVSLTSACGASAGEATSEIPRSTVKPSVAAQPAVGGLAVDTKSAECISDAAVPSWLPSLVSGSETECADGVPGGGSAGVAAVSEDEDPDQSVAISYTLRGAANKDTLPDGDALSKLSDAQLKSGQYHIGTTIDYIVRQGSTAVDDAMDPAFFDISTVQLANGATARVTTPKGGLGAIRVEWVAADSSFTILSSRGDTASGVSGPSVDDLIKMAGSVH